MSEAKHKKSTKHSSSSSKKASRKEKAEKIDDEDKAVSLAPKKRTKKSKKRDDDKLSQQPPPIPPKKLSETRKHKKTSVQENSDLKYLANIAAAENPLALPKRRAEEEEEEAKHHHHRRITRLVSWVSHEGHRRTREASAALAYPYAKNFKLASPDCVSVYEGPSGTIHFVLVEAPGTDSNGVTVSGGEYLLSVAAMRKLCTYQHAKGFEKLVTDVLGSDNKVVTAKQRSDDSGVSAMDVDGPAPAPVPVVTDNTKPAPTLLDEEKEKSKSTIAAQRIIMAEEKRRALESQTKSSGGGDAVVTSTSTIRIPFDKLQILQEPNHKAGSTSVRTYAEWKCRMPGEPITIFWRFDPIMLKERFNAEYRAGKKANKGCAIVVGVQAPGMKKTSSSSALDRAGGCPPALSSKQPFSGGNGGGTEEKTSRKRKADE